MGFAVNCKTAVKVAGLLCAALAVLAGCKYPAEGSPARPRTSERPEYDCRKHAPDKVCEVPWKDKVVLYCYADTVPRVVRYREECS